jgi:hypothetical protein
MQLTGSRKNAKLEDKEMERGTASEMWRVTSMSRHNAQTPRAAHGLKNFFASRRAFSAGPCPCQNGGGRAGGGVENFPYITSFES